METTHIDTYLKLFSDSQRRRIVQQLRDETAGETTVEDLADYLHERESDPLTAARPDRDHLSLQLIHNHLPKLDQHGVVDYDRENKTVRYQPASQVETVLDTLPTEAAQISEL